MAKAIQEQISFYSKNYLTPYCEVIASEGFPDFKPLCDFKPYKTNNVFSINSTSTTFSFNFKDYFGQNISKTISCVIFQNCNIKDLEIDYFESEEAPIPIILSYGNNCSDLTFNFSKPITTSRLQFKIMNVVNPYTFINIGQIRILNKLFDLNATTETSVGFDTKENSQRSYNSDLYVWTDYAKWACQISASGVDKSQYDILARQIYENKFVTIIPWRNFERKDIYEINVNLKDLGFSINRFSGKLSLNIKGIAQENASI